MKKMPRTTGRQRKGQSLVEFALAGILLAMLLAGAVDIGRAFYTYIVVMNMSGEGATVLAQAPDNDCTNTIICPTGCSTCSPAVKNKTFQVRAENVAALALGGIIDHNNVQDSDVVADVPRTDRCIGVPFSVSVGYHMNDLFFPSLLGFQNLTIGATANSVFTQERGGFPCPTPTPIPIPP